METTIVYWGNIRLTLGFPSPDAAIACTTAALAFQYEAASTGSAVLHLGAQQSYVVEGHRD